MPDRSLLMKDCMELHARQYLPSHDFQQWRRLINKSQQQLSLHDRRKLQDLQSQMMKLYQKELDTVIERARTEHNEDHSSGLHLSDVYALATGGLLGAANGWLRSSSGTNSQSKASATTSLWEHAIKGAQATFLAARQHRLIEHFEIQHLMGNYTTSKHVFLCINGFMSQGERDRISKNWTAWGEASNNIALYAVRWEAGSSTDWESFFSNASENLQLALQSTCSNRSTRHTQDLIHNFLHNPWHRAQEKADHVGKLLARVIIADPVFLKGRKVTLLGHSLGAAVITSCMLELAKISSEIGRTQPCIHSALYFAGAIPLSPDVLRTILSQIGPLGKLMNFYSKDDVILSQLFRRLQVQNREYLPAGSAPIQEEYTKDNDLRLVNVNVEEFVRPSIDNQFGHSYGHHMQAILYHVMKDLQAILS